MTYQDIIDKCRQGYTAKIPGWEGYIDYDYAKNEVYFHNKDYRITQEDLENKFQIGKRNDLYYII